MNRLDTHETSFVKASTTSIVLELEPDVFHYIISFLRPKDCARLMACNKDLSLKNLHSHVLVINGKFKFCEKMIDHLYLYENLTCLDLKGNKLTSEGIRTLGNRLATTFSRLEHLDLSALSITIRGIRVLAESLQLQYQDGTFISPLKSLSLAVNNIADEGAEALGDLWESGALPHLKILNLNNTVISHNGLRDVARGLKRCKDIRSLNLSNNPLDQGHSDNPDHLPWQELAQALGPKLQHLSIFNSILSSQAIKALVSHWKCPALLNLNLSWNRLHSAGAQFLARSLAEGCCPLLTTLNISHNHIRGDALEDLALCLVSTSIRKNLRHLNLGWNPLHADSVTSSSSMVIEGSQLSAFLKTLAKALASCQQLESLVLSNVELGEKGVLALAQGFTMSSEDPAAIFKSNTSCPQLVSLNLSWNNIGPKGALTVAQLLLQNAVCPQLTSLDVSYNSIGDKGLRHMANIWSKPATAHLALPSRGLVVHIIGNQITGCTDHYVRAAELPELSFSSSPMPPPPTPTPYVSTMQSPKRRRRNQTLLLSSSSPSALASMVMAATNVSSSEARHRSRRRRRRENR